MVAVHYPSLPRVPECSAAGGRSAASGAAGELLRLPDQGPEWLWGRPPPVIAQHEDTVLREAAAAVIAVS